MNNYFILIAIVVAIAIIGLAISKDYWQGFYYPDCCLTCDSNYIYSPVFKTIERFEAWARAIATERNNPLDDWECGKNCIMEEYGISICKETR